MTGIGDRISTAAQLACLLEASAPKPGNVSPGAAFGDTTYEHFLASAAAIGPALGAAGTRGVGETIYRAVAATRRWTSTNTNLGIVLLLAPLARAAFVHLDVHGAIGSSDIQPTQLRRVLGDVLRGTTIHDAREAYAAIRMANPGGLGTSAEQDVTDDPTVSLTDAMRLAQDRDGIAREYASDFQATFESAVPTLASARTAGFDWNDAVVETFLTVLASFVDTHIARRAGANAAADVTRQAREVVAAGGVRSEAGRAGIARLHAALRGNGNRANPGTTADITAAAIFVVLLGCAWTSPIGPGGHDAAAR